MKLRMDVMLLETTTPATTVGLFLQITFHGSQTSDRTRLVSLDLPRFPLDDHHLRPPPGSQEHGWGAVIFWLECCLTTQYNFTCYLVSCGYV